MKWKISDRANRRPALNTSSWSRALAHCRYAQALATTDRQRLRELADLFVATKSFEGAAKFEPTPTMRAVIALKACVPILNLGLDYYAGWHDIIVYPGDFRVDDEYMDDAGVVHRQTRDLCGQSLTQGPMVLSWSAIEEEAALPDRDLVIHECAHKLDILNGEPNGFPPLHDDMRARQWAGTLGGAFENFGAAVDAQTDTALDPYAATDPAEFFAVLSETFFTSPAIVHDAFPAVYVELAKFYRQDPRAVLPGAS
jgi:Mlc titration factor MtfA (ptsG expression regulator)